MVIFVDVDDTLIRSFGSKRMPIPSVIERVRELHAAGVRLFCWSTAGDAYAREMATSIGLAEIFEAFLPKPHVLIDDAALNTWRLRELHPNELSGFTAAEIIAHHEEARTKPLA